MSIPATQDNRIFQVTWIDCEPNGWNPEADNLAEQLVSFSDFPAEGFGVISRNKPHIAKQTLDGGIFTFPSILHLKRGPSQLVTTNRQDVCLGADPVVLPRLQEVADGRLTEQDHIVHNIRKKGVAGELVRMVRHRSFGVFLEGSGDGAKRLVGLIMATPAVRV